MRDSAYGLRWRGPLAAASLMPGEPAWPLMSVNHDQAPPPPGLDGVNGSRLRLTIPVHSRTLIVDRASRSAVFHGAPVDPHTFVHPFLGPVATVYSRWIGRETFHAGAVEVDGRAWMIMGDREAGKSTLLAACHAAGMPVLVDDLCIVEDGQLFAGPRTLDLREPPSGPLARLVSTPAREARWRVALPDVAMQLPLAGWVLLETGDEIEAHRVPISQRLQRLTGWRGWPSLASRPETFLELSSIPGYRFVRPKVWSRMDETVAYLGRLLSAS